MTGQIGNSRKNKNSRNYRVQSFSSCSTDFFGYILSFQVITDRSNYLNLLLRTLSFWILFIVIFRTLRNNRTRIHKNLFFAMIIQVSSVFILLIIWADLLWRTKFWNMYLSFIKIISIIIGNKYSVITRAGSEVGFFWAPDRDFALSYFQIFKKIIIFDVLGK